MAYDVLDMPADAERAAIATTTMVREWVGRYRYRVWGRMQYRCEACSWEAWVGLGAGVEGPPPLRERSLFVASPFTITCPRCHAHASHVNFGQDEDYGELREPELTEAFFVVGKGDGAELVNIRATA